MKLTYINNFTPETWYKNKVIVIVFKLFAELRYFELDICSSIDPDATEYGISSIYDVVHYWDVYFHPSR